MNRYKNVLPTPATRVVLPQLEEGEDDEIENSDYVNANYVRAADGVTQKYVAAQAPKGETVDRFWRLIWHAKPVIIAMVTGKWRVAFGNLLSVLLEPTLMSLLGWLFRLK